MIAPPLASNELDRIADLRALDILDTPAEERFDRLVRIAARVFDVPIAYIAMVDSDRQWFKSKCGVTAASTGRDVSFCGHTILQNEPMIIPDAKEDERFHDNPLVTGDPHIRFYAGYPLAGPGGANVGTFCIADRRPRAMDDGQLVTFRELASVAEQQVNLMDVIRVQRELIDTKDQLVAAQSKLTEELTEAAAYVRSLLPAPIDEPVRARWRFVSSSQLGGDFFGYHWLDDHQLVIYLLDVCGHGVGASLLSISVHNALRRVTLQNTRYDEPADVLTSLNQAFPMSENNNKFFTIWYGIYDTRTREIRYSAAGHHPAIMLDGKGNGHTELGSANFMIGLMKESDYATEVAQVPPGAVLYVFSDGAFEVPKPDGQILSLAGFVQILKENGGSKADRLTAVVGRVQAIQGSENFVDDTSLIEIEFP